MEPYDGLNSTALRQECKRRGISIWNKENSKQRHKCGYIKLLREDDQRRAVQDTSAAIHKKDLAQLQLGNLAATSSSNQANALPSTLTSTSGYSFLSPSTSMSAPASAAAAATAAVLYPPAALVNAGPAQPIMAPPVSTDTVSVPLPPASSSKSAVASMPNKPKAKAKSKVNASVVVAPLPPTRSIRPRRGCYFRLINVLLTPEFNARWREMNDKIADSDTIADVNQFWLDVHVAYMSVNQLFDGLHFHDALFKNADPSVILAHEASRLRQMWLEVVAKYQRAVADSKKPPILQAEGGGDAANHDETQSFFDSCGKRLDLLYLHMGLLLEPELSKFVLNMASPIGSTGSQRSPPAKPAAKLAATTAGNQKSAAAAAGKKRASVSPSTSKKPVKPRASMTPPKERSTSFSMSTPPQPTIPFSPVRPAAFDVANREREEEDAGQSYALVVSGELRDSAFETFAPHSFGDDGSGSSDYDSELPTRAMVPRKRRRRSSEMSTDIVELHSSALRGNELVPHQGSNNNSRMHNTALTTRTGSGSDLLLPQDEWVILENRLRKVSESLDRCHRALSGSEGQVSESHRMSLESDLRFYSAIKQRLQEQLLMVMQGF